MPSIRPSSDLRNNYNEISNYCREHFEPVYITKNGHGDLVVMSINTYEKSVGKSELYSLLNEGLEDVRNQQVMPAETIFERIERELLP